MPTRVNQLDVLVTLKARRMRYALYGVAAGLLLAVPQVNAAFTAQNIPDDRRLWQASLSILFSAGRPNRCLRTKKAVGVSTASETLRKLFLVRTSSRQDRESQNFLSFLRDR